MKRRPNLNLPALLVVLMLMVVPVRAGDDDDDDGALIVGSWLVDAAFDQIPPGAAQAEFLALVTVDSSRTVLENSTAFPIAASGPGHGAWAKIRGDFFTFTFFKPITDPFGVCLNILRVVANANFDEDDPDRFNGRFDTDLLTCTGDFVMNAFGGSAEATRINAQPPAAE